MVSRRKNLLTLAPLSLFIIVAISAWSQSRLVAWYGNGVVARGHKNLPDAPFYSSMVSSSMLTNTNATSKSLDIHLLQQNDSLYKKYNMSTTPIVIEEYNLLLFTVEKIGSTVLRQLMRRMMGYENYHHHGGGIPHNAAVSGLKVLTDYSLEKANEMLTSDKWIRAMFVRDPKERALSGYLQWKPRGHFPWEAVENARKGLLNETLLTGPGPRSSGLGTCCKNIANGDFNYEVLCFNHMRTFEGFLDMIEEPNKINNGGDGNDEQFTEPHGTTTVWSPQNLRNSPSCPDKHWSPVTSWRMEHKFYPQLNFIGHLETAQFDIHRLLNKLHPNAWERYGASGWGKFRNESMFESSTTVKHSTKAESYLFDYYTNKEIEKRVEDIYNDDYDNTFLHLERVPVGQAQDFYRKRYLQRYDGFD